MSPPPRFDWPFWLLALALIIGFREGAVWLLARAGHPELGNLAGLLALLCVLLLWRRVRALPARLIHVNNTLMKESAFAFLPISAGAVFALASMGSELWPFLLVLTVSTLPPLWLYARLARRGLRRDAP